MRIFTPLIIASTMLLSNQINAQPTTQIKPSTHSNTYCTEDATNDFENLAESIVADENTTRFSHTIGAGVCVSEMGHIVTNAHVVDNYDNINVVNINGDKFDAKVVYQDSVLDIAVLQVTQSNIPPLELCTDIPNVGDSVIAVGTPLSLVLKHTYTKGIISAVNRTIKVNGTDGEYYMSGLLQHDASLNYGNSGGPLLDNCNRIIGINTLKITGGEGIGFAIPCKAFVSILDKVITHNLHTPYLGLYGVDCSIAKFNKLTNNNDGYYIQSISDNSPVYGICEVGDIVTAIDGTSIHNTIDYRHELYKFNAGDMVDITIYRDNQLITKKIQLGTKPNC